VNEIESAIESKNKPELWAIEYFKMKVQNATTKDRKDRLKYWHSLEKTVRGVFEES
jgi:hypothetical protein